MRNISRLGPYEIIKDDPELFSKLCTIEVNKNKKVSKQAGKPSFTALWSFILNPRDNILPVDEYSTPTIGYNNYEFMSIFQMLNQRMWRIFEPKFNEFISIIPIYQAIKAGLYEEDLLREQFPGPNSGNAPGYKGGSFNHRQIGGWRWFSLILDEENWENRWIKEEIPERMTLTKNIKEKITPKFYRTNFFKDGKWKENRHEIPVYVSPLGCKIIPRRYCIPVVDDKSKDIELIQRYKKFTSIYLKNLNTQWTLGIWNIVSFDYKDLKKNVVLEIQPELNIDIGWIETDASGKKKWGESGEGLHRHFEGVYRVRVGLPKKYKLSLQRHVDNQENPFWNGEAKNLAKILEVPYSKLVDLAITNLKKLID